MDMDMDNIKTSIELYKSIGKQQLAAKQNT